MVGGVTISVSFLAENERFYDMRKQVTPGFTSLIACQIGVAR